MIIVDCSSYGPGTMINPKRKSMTHFKCCICGHASGVRINFKFDCKGEAYCIKNKHTHYIEKVNKNELYSLG